MRSQSHRPLQLWYRKTASPHGRRADHRRRTADGAEIQYFGQHRSRTRCRAVRIKRRQVISEKGAVGRCRTAWAQQFFPRKCALRSRNDSVWNRHGDVAPLLQQRVPTLRAQPSSSYIHRGIPAGRSIDGMSTLSPSTNASPYGTRGPKNILGGDERMEPAEGAAPLFERSSRLPTLGTSDASGAQRPGRPGRRGRS